MDIPKIKKKISSFLTKEDGKISKKNLVTVGVAITSIATAMAATANHDNTYTVPSSAGDCTSTAKIANDHVNSTHDNGLKATPKNLGVGGIHSNCVETHDNHTSY